MGSSIRGSFFISFSRVENGLGVEKRFTGTVLINANPKLGPLILLANQIL